MAEPSRKRQRTTPRNSNANETVAPAETPYSNLRQLASAIQTRSTPHRRPSSAAGPTSASRFGNRTPGTASRTPRGAFTRPVIARRGPPTTPHAIRALQARRNAALTPGRDRRRSGRMQRETPRDVLRNLSRVLARTTQPVQPTPPPPSAKSSRNAALDDFDEGPDLPVPRLSMPLNDLEDDDSFHEPPPRLSLAPDDMEQDYTAHSLEGGRRALTEDPRLRRSRVSFGGMRLSERFADINELGPDDVDVDGTFVRFGDDGGELMVGEDDEEADELGEEHTATLRDFLHRRQSRQSDIGIGGDDDEEEQEPTFRFTIPQRRQSDYPNVGAGEEEAKVEEDLDEEEDEEEQPLPDAEPADEYTDEEEAEMAEEEDLRLRRDSADEAEAEPTGRRASAKDASALSPSKTKKRKRRALNVSKHGIEYPSLPSAVIRRLATAFARQQGSRGAKISKETLEALVQTSDWFFEQAAEDLASYAEHAGRKTIEETDVVMLMRRQRQINPSTTAFSLAQKYLPRELLQEIRMPVPAKTKATRKKRMQTIAEDEEE